MPTGNLDHLRNLEAEAGGNKERSLNRLVADLLGHPYMRDGLARAGVLDAFPGVLESVLGPRAPAACRAVAIHSGSLIVETTDSIWSQKVAMAAERLLAALAAAELAAAPERIEVRTRVG